MKRWRAALVAAVAVVGASLAGAGLVQSGQGASTRPAAATVGGRCNLATAQKLSLDRVAGVLCRPFLGPGSHAMVVMITNGTCMSILAGTCLS
jgi:hypothetical protein